MASKKHQAIVNFIAGRIQKLGFEIKYLEGDTKDVTMIQLRIPPKILMHRPDVIGVKSNSIAIGEAKSETDLKTERTKTQLLDFKEIIRKHKDNLLVIGIPSTAKEELVQLMNKLGITINEQIFILEIPEIFL